MSASKIKIMGVLNVTPDSFSDGGQFATIDSAVTQAEKLITEGADILDIGGESTRPFADKVGTEEELQRVIPVIRAIRQKHSIPISIDTTKSTVAIEALKAGATHINDISALRSDPEMIDVARTTSVPIIIMHMQGTPDNMQIKPTYTDIIEEMLAFFTQRLDYLNSRGVETDRIIIDPGIGFGKTLAHNLQLIQNTATLKQMGFPILMGVSRKSMFAELLNRPVDQRLSGSLAAAQFAYLQGADYFRVHDVAETVDVLTVSQALISSQFEDEL